MQIKKNDPILKPNEVHENQENPVLTKDVGRKKIILLGLGAGVLSAVTIALGALYFYSPTLVLKNVHNIARFIEFIRTPKTTNPPLHLTNPPNEQVAHLSDKQVSPPSPLPEVSVSKQPPQKSVSSQPLGTEVSSAQDLDDILPPTPSVPAPLLRKKTPLQPKMKADDINILNPTTYQYDAFSPGPTLLLPQKTNIEVSRDAHFKSIYMQGRVIQSGEFLIPNPPPGFIYWRMKGSEKVYQIKVQAPQSTNLQIKIPSRLGINESISWSGNQNVSFYKIDIASDENFSSAIKTWSTKETSFLAQFIGPGQWYLRLAAMNMQSGSFEYSKVIPVVIENSEFNL